MESQLMRSKALLVKEKELKWKQMKTQTPSRRAVSSSSFSSSCPDYCQTEVFVVNIDNNVEAELITEIAATEVLPAVYHTESPSISIDEDDHRDQGIVEISAATSNQVDEQMIMASSSSSSSSSSELSVFQKSELSKGMLAIVTTVIMALFIYLKSYSSDDDDESEIPQWFIIFVLCILFFGATFIIIGIVLREMISRIAHVLEVAGFLLILLGVFGLGSSMMPIVLIWVSWLSYIIICITLLLDLFPKLVVDRIHPMYFVLARLVRP